MLHTTMLCPSCVLCLKAHVPAPPASADSMEEGAMILKHCTLYEGYTSVPNLHTTEVCKVTVLHGIIISIPTSAV
jgi:hypothetical protein